MKLIALDKLEDAICDCSLEDMNYYSIRRLSISFSGKSAAGIFNSDRFENRIKELSKRYFKLDSIRWRWLYAKGVTYK